MKKTYDVQAAKGLVDPGVGQEETSEVDPKSLSLTAFVADLPEEFQAEIEEALSALLSYLHSDEGMSTIIEQIKQEDNMAASIGKAAIKAMAACDQDQSWSDSAKAMAGFFGVREISNILREGEVIDLSEKQEGMIYEVAAKSFILAAIKSKPTTEEREAEAMRWQKEVDPLVQGPLREKLLGPKGQQEEEAI